MGMIAMHLWFFMPGCAIVLVIMWLVFGRDKRTIPTITVSPPGGLDPLEMEYAQIVTITDRGIYAELLYWVSKGYLKVREEDGRIGMDKIAELPADAPEHATFLFEGLFRKSNVVWLNNFPPAISEHKDKILERVRARFLDAKAGKTAAATAGKNGSANTGKNKGASAGDSESVSMVVQNDTMGATIAAMVLLIIAIFVIEVTVDVGVGASALLGVALFFTLAFLQNGALGFRSKHIRFEVVTGTVGTAVILILHLVLLYLHTGNVLFVCVFAVCFLICVPCILFMERRINHRLYGQILGFREYIETAEWDMLKQLSEEDPNYGMDILPYAMLFNMGTKWTATFENKSITTCVEQMEDKLK